MAYDFRAVEAKWQAKWETAGLHTPDLAGAKEPYYNLMMFPYPSAEGLHVGNCYSFTCVDCLGRYQRLKGKDVFEPIGFDAFGMHSENFAIKTGTHPSVLIPKSIANFTRQLKAVGLMLDWTRTVDTTDPGYYRWTQWIFLKLYEKGLAYEREAPVTWCPSCQTVLSDEQAEGGVCERCESPVEKRNLRQWFFRITAYAERLLAGLDGMDWSEITKSAQRNWIGKSEGAEVVFGTPAGPLTVFTTRPDTLFGATYMVLAPEHPFVGKLAAPGQRAAVDAYVRQAAAMSPLEREKGDRKKTGVFTGAAAVNPATGKEIPVWVADYVLSGYGTGAIMAVPAHDERDHAFAEEFNLPIVEVVDRPRGPLFTGTVGVPGGPKKCFEGEGTMVNSGPYDGLPSAEARKKIVTDLEKKGAARFRVNYRLRDWCISRQRYWGPPIPAVRCAKCGTVPVPEKDLPVRLPEMPDIRPDGSGKSPLARSAAFVKTACPTCKGPAERETDVSDNFLDSAWYFLRYLSPRDGQRIFDPALAKKWLPVDHYIGGNEHAVLHLMYVRFLAMALHDVGVLPVETPFARFRVNGMITRDGGKMSKSKGNVVSPDEYVERYGADVLRTYLMFMGPVAEGGDFSDRSIGGVAKFLERVHRIFTEKPLADRPVTGDARTLMHKSIKRVEEGIERLSYNVSIAQLMEWSNDLANWSKITRDELSVFARLLAPFAPHLADELHERTGDGKFVLQAGWPVFDPKLAVGETVEIAVQVNGKLRGTVAVPPDADEAAAFSAAAALPKVAEALDGKSPKKRVYVKGRLVNFVV